MASIQIQPQLMDEVIDFLIGHPTLEEIAAFHPSETMQERIRYLLDANQNRTLSAEEQVELEEISRINHFMTMFRARIRERFLQK